MIYNPNQNCFMIKIIIWVLIMFKFFLIIIILSILHSPSIALDVNEEKALTEKFYQYLKGGNSGVSIGILQPSLGGIEKRVEYKWFEELTSFNNKIKRNSSITINDAYQFDGIYLTRKNLTAIENIPINITLECKIAKYRKCAPLPPYDKTIAFISSVPYNSDYYHLSEWYILPTSSKLLEDIQLKIKQGENNDN